MTQNIAIKLNLALLDAFEKYYPSSLYNKDLNLNGKVKDYVDRTEKPLDEDPLYHKAAKILLTSLWTKAISDKVPEKSLKDLSRYEYKKRKVFAYHRDHIAHSASVFLLGLVLIDRCYEIRQAIFRWPHDNPLSKIQCIESWMWCATLHDLGYPVQNITALDKWAQLTNFFRINFAQYFEKPEFKDALSDNDSPEHGLTSAAIALDIFDKCRNRLNCKNLTIKSFDHVIRAIAFHDEKYGQEFFKVNVKDDPFLFLLIFCDELQCWNRPSKGIRPFIRSDFVTFGIEKTNNKEIIQLSIKSSEEIEAKIEMLKEADKQLRDKLDLSLLQLEIRINGQTVRSY